ncbi:hypothetical protein ES703_118509 [subsurface metagenome]
MSYINDKKIAEIRNALGIIIRQVARIDRLIDGNSAKSHRAANSDLGQGLKRHKQGC